MTINNPSILYPRTPSAHVPFNNPRFQKPSASVPAVQHPITITITTSLCRFKFIFVVLSVKQQQLHHHRFHHRPSSIRLPRFPATPPSVRETTATAASPSSIHQFFPANRTPPEEPPQRTVISEIPTTTVDTQPIQHTSTTWPEFGFPHNYSLPVAITSMVGQYSRPVFQAPVFTEPQPIVHTSSCQPAAQAAFGNPLFEYHIVSL
ncbi:unnamed protein product [Vicia faba]|uniref:Uncharacterized protein n=1 Tax=Vicia faba TaxID=3906 RepID=A0AAV1B8T6_VICFA|nr:unnamed protein product [Vicia faba]